jgi:hypothetical protein
MIHLRYICIIAIVLLAPVFVSCGGGGSDSGSSKPPLASTDPADIVASIRYQVANISYTQSSSIIAKVFDANGDRVKDGTPVRFTLNENNITKTGYQTSVLFSNGKTTFDTVTTNGFCTAILSLVGVLTQECNVATVTIRPIGFIQVLQNVNVAFFSNTSSSFGIILTADDATIPGDGFSSTVIRAKILNAFGNPPISGPITIDFTTSPSGVGTLSSASVVADQNGEASVNFTSTQVVDPTSVIITAVATIPSACFAGSYSASDMISVGLTPQVIGSIVVSADPTTIFTYGTADDTETPNTSTVSAIVDDENGFPIVDNTLIKFTAKDRDTGEPIGIIDPFALTSNGVAEVTLKAGFKAGVAEITAEDSSGAVAGATFVVIETDLSIDGCSPPTGSTEEEYFYDFSQCATGGFAPYTFALDPDFDNQLSGLTLSEDGILSGTPSDNVRIRVIVTDAFGNTAKQTFNIAVSTGEALAISPASGSFTSGSLDSITFTATGGTGSFFWSLNVGSVQPASAFTITPSGSTAVVAYNGTAIVTPGSLTVTVSDGTTTSAPVTITVNP